MSTNDPTPADQPVPAPDGVRPRAKKPVDPARVEQLTSQLKSSVRRRRPWRVTILAALLLLFAIPVGLILWRFWPREPPPDLQVVAFDELLVGQGEIQVRAQLIVVDGQTGTVHYPDCPVMVVPETPAAPGQTPVSVTPDQDGRIECPWPQTPAGLALFKVVYSDFARKVPRDDRARVWVVAEDARVLLVDVHALAADPAAFRKADQLGKQPALAAAREALQKAQNAGMVIAYLPSASTDARRYSRVREWLQVQNFPDGPVLFYPDVDASQEKREAFHKKVSQYASLPKGTAVLLAPGFNLGHLPNLVPVQWIEDPERDWAELEKKWAGGK
jgi:hypothetical protein